MQHDDKRLSKAKRWLKRSYPALFGDVYRPFAIDIHKPIIAAAPQGIRNAVRFAILQRTRHDLYLLELRKKNAMRFGPDGAPVGKVSTADAEFARWLQRQRNAQKRSRVESGLEMVAR